MKTNVRRFVRNEWVNLLFWSWFFAMWMTMLIEGLVILPSTTGPGR
jgi:hypothetical protein